MDISYYANLAEIIGTTAIVVSLIYVAVQIRQSNRHMAQEAQRTRAQAVRENLARMADNAELMVKDGAGEALSAAEAIRLNLQWMGALFSFQTSFQQLPRNEIEAHLNFFRSLLKTNPSLRATWKQRRETFQPEFIQYMDENVFSRS